MTQVRLVYAMGPFRRGARELLCYV